MEISLTVNDAKKRDVGRGIARIDKVSAKKLNLEMGEVILLTGKRKTSAITWPCYNEDKGKGLVRIDRSIRQNAGTAINDVVKVNKAEVENAQGVALAPIDMRLNVDQDFIDFVKNRLVERVFTEGDEIPIIMLGHAIPFDVVRVAPHNRDCVKVVSDTHLSILNEPIEIIRRKRLKTPDLKMLFRHDWLASVSSRLKARKTTFSLIDKKIEKENEDAILSVAKTVVDQELRQIDISVRFYSDKGDLIGDLPWITIDLFGDVRAVYPDINLPPLPEYSRVEKRETEIAPPFMQRCFKTGLKKCPKEINFSPKLVFVAMPFKSAFQDLYKYAIRPALEDIGFEIWKADEKISNIDIMCKMCQGIQECSYVIANISDWNPNVLFEMGLAYGIGKSVILIKDRKESVPVDLKGLEYVDYETIDELKRNIIAFFKSIEGGLRRGKQTHATRKKSLT